MHMHALYLAIMRAKVKHMSCLVLIHGKVEQNEARFFKARIDRQHELKATNGKNSLG